MTTLLSGLRALDLTDEKGYFCGQVLAKLGVEVVKVERPGGDPGRLIGPFYEDVPDKERSINWFAGNSNKKGITLNIEDEKGQELLKRLVTKADFLIESFSPNYLDELGLGYIELSRINPGLIMTSITPFGPEGPYKDYVTSDLVTEALGGVMSLIGHIDKPPLRAPADLSYYFTGGHATVGTMAAYHHRRLTGEGQHVNVSLMECLIRLHYLTPYLWENDKVLQLRGGYTKDKDGKLIQKNALPSRWRCKDGWISVGVPLPPARSGSALRRMGAENFIQWMIEDGVDVGELSEMNWGEFDTSMLTTERKQNWVNIITRFFTKYTRQELFELATARGMMPTPSWSIGDLLRNEQLEARGFWQEAEHPELERKVLYPGHLFLTSETENRIPERAPHVGEHNESVYGQELELSAQQTASLKKAGII